MLPNFNKHYCGKQKKILIVIVDTPSSTVAQHKDTMLPPIKMMPTSAKSFWIIIFLLKLMKEN